MITFSKHGDQWALCGMKAELTEGEIVEVQKRNGPLQKQMVGKYLGTREDGRVMHVCERVPQGMVGQAAIAQTEAVMRALSIIDRKLDTIMNRLACDGQEAKP